MVGSSRRRRLAGAGALVIALGYLLTLIPSAGAARTDRLTLRRGRARSTPAARHRTAGALRRDRGAGPGNRRRELAREGAAARRRPPANDHDVVVDHDLYFDDYNLDVDPERRLHDAHAGYTPCESARGLRPHLVGRRRPDGRDRRRV